MSQNQSIKPEMDFLLNSSNSHIREELLNLKLFYDLKLEALKVKRHLKIYKPEIDIEGYDIIIEDDTDLARKIQLKSRMSTKCSWEIHRTLLLPAMHNAVDYGFIANHCPTNPGALILFDVLKSADLSKDEIIYYYTDINIISLIALGYLDKTKYQENARKTLIELKSNSKRVKISINLMVKLKNPKSIIKLCGFLNNYDFSNNTWQINQLINNPSGYFKNYNPYIYDDELKEFETKKMNAIRGHYKVISEILNQI